MKKIYNNKVILGLICMLCCIIIQPSMVQTIKADEYEGSISLSNAVIYGSESAQIDITLSGLSKNISICNFILSYDPEKITINSIEGNSQLSYNTARAGKIYFVYSGDGVGDAILATITVNAVNSEISTTSEISFWADDVRKSAYSTADARKLNIQESGADVELISTKECKIIDFVKRMYTVVLNREAEEEGVAAWKNALMQNLCNGATMCEAFFGSEEFTAAGVNDLDFLNRMYEAIMGRTADEDGINVWSEILQQGVSRNFVLSYFVTSNEFTDICASYGIDTGTIELSESRDMNYNLTCFVQRCYNKVFDRAADVDGLNAWCGAMLEGACTPAEVAYDFLFSPEAISYGWDDNTYVQILYRTFMGREYDEEGLNVWLEQLAGGMSREEVFVYFAGSAEFAEIVASYGL